MGRNLWIESSDAEIDYRIIPFDTKRAIRESPETMLGDGLGITMLKKYARISRGASIQVDLPSNLHNGFDGADTAVLRGGVYNLIKEYRKNGQIIQSAQIRFKQNRFSKMLVKKL